MFIEAKDGGGGGDNWTIGAISRGKAPVESSPPTSNFFLQAGCPTNGVKALKGISADICGNIIQVTLIDS